jgi:tripartite-type tricarboxylate transporter receptor subunit TctC
MAAGRRARRAIALCAAAIGLATGVPVLPNPAAAAYPDHPIRLVVPFAPGAGTDAIARIIGAKLADALGQQIVIDNRSGAGGSIGTEIVAKAGADGYTLLLAPTSHAINPSLYPKLPYDAKRDFAVISIVGALPVVLAVNSAVPAHSVAELVALAKAKAGSLLIGSAGNGTVFHLTAELFMEAAGIRMTHVPYRGGAPAVSALIGGEVTALFETSLTLQPHVVAGTVRALAVASTSRAAVMPNVPTLAEAGYPNIIAENWYGLYAPAATPADVLAQLYGELAKVLKDPDARERLNAQGVEIRHTTPEQAAAFLDGEFAKWQRVVAQANVHAD